jgi:hypothetical protein
MFWAIGPKKHFKFGISYRDLIGSFRDNSSSHLPSKVIVGRLFRDCLILQGIDRQCVLVRKMQCVFVFVCVYACV